VTALSDEIDDGPTIFAPLKMVETEVSQFPSSETATEQDSDDGAVALALESLDIGRLPKRPGIGRG
jgi:hypothetical protein